MRLKVLLSVFVIGLFCAATAFAEESCVRSFWGNCTKRKRCAAGTHSAGAWCYPTYTDYTYWLFGAPMPSNKICGCAPPPIPYTRRKYDDNGYPIRDDIRSQINDVMKDVDMEAVRRYYAAVDQAQALIKANTALVTGEPIDTSPLGESSCSTE